MSVNLYSAGSRRRKKPKGNAEFHDSKLILRLKIENVPPARSYVSIFKTGTVADVLVEVLKEFPEVLSPVNAFLNEVLWMDPENELILYPELTSDYSYRCPILIRYGVDLTPHTTLTPNHIWTIFLEQPNFQIYSKQMVNFLQISVTMNANNAFAIDIIRQDAIVFNKSDYTGEVWSGTFDLDIHQIAVSFNVRRRNVLHDNLYPGSWFYIHGMFIDRRLIDIFMKSLSNFSESLCERIYEFAYPDHDCFLLRVPIRHGKILSYGIIPDPEGVYLTHFQDVRTVSKESITFT